MKIIQNSYVEEIVRYIRNFSWADQDDPYYGFCFDSDENGNVDIDNLSSCARNNYEKCINGEHNVVDLGVKKLVHNYKHPKIGLCDCGEAIFLDSFTNTCECGVDYNSSGQKLADRSQWGEETNEHWTECY